MILPDPDSKNKTNNARSDPRDLHQEDNDGARTSQEAYAPPERLVPAPEALPPYTPRETEPLLLSSSKRNRTTGVRLASKSALLLLSGLCLSVVAWAAWRLQSPWTDSHVCQMGDTWLWVDRTERDPKFYVDGGATLPATLSALSFESTSPGVHGTLEIEASSLGRTPTVALVVRAGHPDLAVLRRLALCTRTFANGTAHMALMLRGAPPASPVWLDIALTLPGPAYARHGPRRAPDLAVRVAATNISATHLIGRVGFDSLSLTTTDGGINMGPTQADHIVLRADGHPLVANLHAGASVTLTNTAGPVNALIAVAARDLALVAHSSAAAVDVRISAAPVGARLTAHIDAPAGAALLALPPVFEGAYLLRATGGDVKLDAHEGAVDPSGRGRRREGWHRRTADGAVEGRTYWGDEREEQRMGSVDISGASAGLQL